MSQTRAQIRSQVLLLLEDMPWLDKITADVAATPAAGDISLTVNDPANWPANSRWEIDTEVFYTKTGGTNPITATRAYESSTAAAHTSGTQARRDMRWLTVDVNYAINVVLSQWLSTWIPKLVDDPTTAGNFVVNRWIYPAPIDAKAINRVYWTIPGYIKPRGIEHSGLRVYSTDIVSTGLGFEVYEFGLFGRPVRVLYEKNWAQLATDTDSTDSQFPDEGLDLLVTGTALYLVGWRQIPKFKLDETIFYREANAPNVPNLVTSQMQIMKQNWVERVKQVRSRRPQTPMPSKVWAGLK